MLFILRSAGVLRSFWSPDQVPGPYWNYVAQYRARGQLALSKLAFRSLAWSRCWRDQHPPPSVIRASDKGARHPRLCCSIARSSRLTPYFFAEVISCHLQLTSTSFLFLFRWVLMLWELRIFAPQDSYSLTEIHCLYGRLLIVQRSGRHFSHQF